VAQLFAESGIDSYTYGSVARGDIHADSDIDIVLLKQIPSYRVELLLDKCQSRILQKVIVQATPNDIIKAHYELEDDITITLLLTNFRQLAFEFYKFGGALTPTQLHSNIRVPGVDKSLILIKPTEAGHEEYSLHEYRFEAKDIVGVSQQMIDRRIRILTQRDKKGRTGVFLRKILHPSENIEEKLREIARTNSLVRRRLKN
jgi:hypothetical protein